MASTGILVRRNTAQTLRKLRPLAIMMALAIAILLIADSVVSAGIARYSKSVTSDSSLNMVQVSSITSGSMKPITKGSLDEFAGIPHVADVYGWAQVDLTIDNPAQWPGSDNPGALWGTPYIRGVSPKITDGSVGQNGPGLGEIILPRSSSFGDFAPLLGQTVRFGYTQMISPGNGALATIELKVAGMYDNSTPGADGTQPSYISSELLAQLISSRQFGNADMSDSDALPFDRAFIKPEQPDNLSDIQSAVSGMGYGVFSIANQIDSLPGLFRLLSFVTWAVGIFLVLFCVGVGGSMGGSWINQRVREVGILKAVGWPGGAISRAFCYELALVGAAIAVCGVTAGVLGSLATTTIVGAMDLELLRVEPWTLPNALWIASTLLIVPAFLCLGALRSAIGVARMDADSALRDL